METNIDTDSFIVAKNLMFMCGMLRFAALSPEELTEEQRAIMLRHANSVQIALEELGVRFPHQLQ